jgi:hypothetical protein
VTPERKSNVNLHRGKARHNSLNNARRSGCRQDVCDRELVVRERLATELIAGVEDTLVRIGIGRRLAIDLDAGVFDVDNPVSRNAGRSVQGQFRIAIQRQGGFCYLDTEDESRMGLDEHPNIASS